MRVVADKPPIFDRIVAAFPDAAKPGIVFAWGGIIYSPSGTTVSPEIRAHEGVHALRQGTDIEGWWDRYIADPEFRLAEEIPAHRKQYFMFCRRHGNRNQRAQYLDVVSKALAAPLYGGLLSPARARAAILGAA